MERGVDSQATWAAFSRSGDRPRDIPGNPHQTYKGKGRLGLTFGSGSRRGGALESGFIGGFFETI